MNLSSDELSEPNAIKMINIVLVYDGDFVYYLSFDQLMRGVGRATILLCQVLIYR